jgi:hypothetical protein
MACMTAKHIDKLIEGRRLRASAHLVIVASSCPVPRSPGLK